MDVETAIQRYIALSTTIDTHADQLTEIVKATGDNLEGNCFTIHQTTKRDEALLSKRINLFTAASQGSQILELGFNAGHSALLLLLGCKEGATLEFLDIGGHPYVRPCFQYLQQIRPEVPRRLVLGDSKHVLPLRVLRDGERDVYDLIHMDGGHSMDCVINDLTLLYQLLKPGGWMIIDDADGFILEEINRFLRLGLFRHVQGQLETGVYPHLIVSKPERTT